MLASSVGDPVIGLDIHYELVPTPAPTPTPIPNPFTGVIFDPLGLAVGLVITNAINFVTGAPPAGPVVYWGAFPATNTGTEAQHVPGHILIPPGTAWAPFPKTPKPMIRPGETPKPGLPVKPEDDAVCVFGSKTVTVMGSNAVRLGDILLSCSEPVRLPSSVVMAVPKGAPILIGGPRSLDLMAAAFASLRTRFVSDSLHAALSRMKPSRFRNMLHRAACFLTGHPVDVASGKVLTEAVDVDLPGPLPLKIERVYASSSAGRDGALGHGWAHSLDQAIWEERGKVVYLAADGREIEFDCFDFPGHRMRPGDELWHAIDRLTLRREARDDWTLRTDDGRALHFGAVAGRPAGRAMLQRISSDRGPADIALGYDARGLLEWVRDSAGRHLRFEHDAYGRLVALLLPNPHDSGDARSWYAHRTYHYDAEGDLVEVTDPLGHSYHYQYASHLLVRETDRVGLNFYFEYDGFGEDAWCIRTWGDGGILDHAIAYDKQNRVTRVTDSLGHTKTYHMNLAGAVVKIVDAHGNATEIEYNDALRMTAVVDAAGGTTKIEWNRRGKCVRTTRPDGSSISITYDDAGRAVELVDAVGGKWKRSYDAQGRPQECVDPIGRTMRVSHDTISGLVREILHRNGSRTLLEHDGAGNVTAARDPVGLTTRFSYDGHGRLTDVRDALGKRESYRYDLGGRLIEATGSDGSVFRFARDGEGNLTEARGPNGLLMKTTHAGFRRRVNVWRAGGEVRHRFDTEQRLIELENAAGETQHYEYDACGRVKAVARFDGGRWVYERDALGRVTKIRRPSGDAVERSYDAGGRVAEMKYADGTSDRFVYRPDGALLEAVNDAASIRFERDPVGQTLREWQDEKWVESQYDVLGNRVGIASSLGGSQVIQRSALGDVESVRADDSSEPWYAAFRRDQRGGELERRLPGDIVSSWERDTRGQPVARKVRRGGRLLDAVRYRWDAGERLGELVDGSGRSTTFTHDEAGRLVAARFDDDLVQYRASDHAGNFYRTRDRSDREYAAGGRLRRDVDSTFTYDAEGRCVERRLGDGARWAYRYDGAGRLAAVTRPDGKRIDFSYDALGRRVSKSAPNGKTRWLWDGAVPLHEVSSEGPATQWIFHPETFSPLGMFRGNERYGIVTDHLGTPAGVYDEAGQLAWQAQLDVYGVPRDANGSQRVQMPWRWPGQYADDETGLHYNRHRYYDPSTGQYLTPDPIGLAGGGTPYGYVSDPSRFIDPMGLEECTPYYHGTTSDDAQRIVSRGIDLGAQTGRLDFDPFHNGSFYVTRDLEQAKRWAAQTAAERGGEPAVVKFDVPDSEMAALDNKVFTEGDEEWADFVRKSRSGAGGPEHHPHDTVTGPFVTNPKEAEKAMSAKPLRSRGDQTAVSTPDAARVFDNSEKEILSVD